MPIDNSKLYETWKDLKSKGYFQKEWKDFAKYWNGGYENRKAFYDDLHGKGYFTSPSYEAFMEKLQKPTTQVKTPRQAQQPNQVQQPTATVQTASTPRTENGGGMRGYLEGVRQKLAAARGAGNNMDSTSSQHQVGGGVFLDKEHWEKPGAGILEVKKPWTSLFEVPAARTPEEADVNLEKAEKAMANAWISGRGILDGQKSYDSVTKAHIARAKQRGQYDAKFFDELYKNTVAPIYKAERIKASTAEKDANLGIVGAPVYGASIMRAYNAEKYNDPQKVMDATLAKVSGSDEYADYIYNRAGLRVGKGESSGKGGERPLTDDERQWINKRFSRDAEEVAKKIQSRLYAEYKAANAPKSKLEWILSKALTENFVASLTESLVRRAANSSGLRQQIRAEALSEYGDQQSWGWNAVAGAAPFAVDIVSGGFALPNAVGNLAGKQVLRGVTKEATKRAMAAGMSKEAATKAAEAAAARFVSTQSPVTGIVQRMVSGAANFGTYDVQSEAVRQLGEGDFDLGRLAGRGLHGVALGGVLGSVGSSLSAATRNSSTVGKVLGDVAGVGAEINLFAASSGIEKAIEDGIYITDVNWGEQYGEAAGMVVGMKAAGGVMRPGTLLARYRKSSDYDVKLDKHNIEELKEAGYDLGSIFQVPRDLGKLVPFSDKAGVKKQVREGKRIYMKNTGANQERVNADAYLDIMQRGDISSETKRKLAYLAEGKVYRPEPVYGATITRNDDGTAQIVTTNYKGDVIGIKDFKNQKDADTYFLQVRDNARQNNIEGIIRVADELGSNDADFAGDAQRFNNLSYSVGRYVADIAKRRTDSEYGDALESGLKKKAGERTETEESALDAYVRNLQDAFMEVWNRHQERIGRQGTQLREGMMQRAGRDGMLHPAKVKVVDNENHTYKDKDVYVVDGHIEVREDGSIDIERSDEMIIVADNDGQRHTVYVKDISGVGEVEKIPSAEELNASAEAVEGATLDAANVKQNTPGTSAEAEGNGGQMPGVDKVGAPLAFAKGDVYAVKSGEDVMRLEVVGRDKDNDVVVRDVATGEEATFAEGVLQSLVDDYRREQVQPVEETTETPLPQGANEGDGTVEYKHEDLAKGSSRTTIKGGGGTQIFTDGNAQSQQSVAAPVEQQAEAAPKQVQEPMPVRKDGSPDFVAAGAERTHKFLSEESGMSGTMARNFAKANAEKAQKDIDDADKKLRKLEENPGTDFAGLRKKIAELQARKEQAQQSLEFWNGVKGEQDKAEVARREEQRKRDAEHQAVMDADEQAYLEEEAAKAAERKARGINAAGEAVRGKWDAAPKIEGAENEIILANGEKVAGRYVLVESGAATPSHDAANGFSKSDGFPFDENGQSVNDRDYERDQNAQDVTRQMAAQYDGRAVQDVPVVSREGVVLSGNGRTMAGELAARNGTDAAYVEHLKKHPQQFGFTPEQVEGMEHPRVVFVPDADMPYTAETFAKFNAQSMKSQSKTEQAVKLGKTVDDGTFNRIIRSMNAYDTIGDFYNDATAAGNAIAELQKAGVINQMQYAEMFDGEKVSEAGRQMLENMLIGKAFESNPDAVRQLTEIPSLRQSVISALAEISNNVGLGGEYSLEQEIADAIDLAYRARKAGTKAGDPVSEFARQGELFGDETVADYKNATVMMLADTLNDNRQSQLKKVLALYNRAAEDSASGQMELFDGGVKSKEDIINDVLEILNYDTERLQSELDAARAQRKAAAGQGGGSESVQQDGTAGAVNTDGEATAEPSAEPAPVENEAVEAAVGGEESATTDEESRKSFATVFTQFKGKAKEAIDYILGRKTGRAIAALHHKDVGDIDLWYGNDKAGLKKIAQKHPEVLGDLQGIIDGMRVVKSSDNRIILESDTHIAVVSKMLGSEKTDNWLLSAYEKKEASGGSSDIVPEPERGKQNGTAPLQSTPSAGKGSASSADVQEKVEENAGENQTPKAVQTALAAAEQETNTRKSKQEEKRAPIKSWTTKKGRKIELFIMPETTDEDGNRHVKIGRSVDGGEIQPSLINPIYVSPDIIDYGATYGENDEEFIARDKEAGTTYGITEVIYLPDGRIVAKGLISGEKANFWLTEDPLITPVSKEEFTKPFAEYSSVKPLGDTQLGEQPTAGYSIEPTTYTNKKGKTTPMHLVTFGRELSKDEIRAGKELAKESRGWWDREKGGFMMRDEDSAKALAEALNNEEAVQDAQPLSVEDVATVTDQADIKAASETIKVEQEPQTTPQYDYDREDDVYNTVLSGFQEALKRSGGIPNIKAIEKEIRDLRKRAKTIEDGMATAAGETIPQAFDALANLNGKRRAFEQYLVDIRKKMAETERDDALAAHGVKLGDKIMYKGKEATIHDADSRQVTLDVGLAPVLYEVTDWENVELPKREPATPQPKKVNVESLMGELGRKGEAKLSDHTEEQDGKVQIVQKKDLEDAFGRTIVNEERGDEIFIGKFVDSTHVAVKWNGTPEAFLWEQLAKTINKENWEWKDETSRTVQEESTEQPKQEEKKAKSKWVDDADAERFEELRKRLHKALNGQLNMGIPPEAIAAGVEMTYLMLKHGARKFGEFAKNMIELMGENVRPYIKSFYNMARDMPDLEQYEKELTPYDEVRTFDVMNFDKEGAKDIVATAEHIVREQAAEREAKEATDKLKQERNEQRKETEQEVAANTEALASEAATVASEVESKLPSARSEREVNDLAKNIDDAIDKVNDQLALLGYYEAEPVESDFNEAYGYMRNAEKKAVKNVTELFKTLTKELGISDPVVYDTKGKKQKSVTANIAPAGGDVTMRFMLNRDKGVELYIDFMLEPDYENNRDNLVLKGIMFRPEKNLPNGGRDYLRANNFFPVDVTVPQMLQGIRSVCQEWLPAEDYVAMAQRVAAENAGNQKEKTSKGNKSKKKSVSLQEQTIPDLFSGLIGEEELNSKDNDTARTDNTKGISREDGSVGSVPADRDGVLDTRSTGGTERGETTGVSDETGAVADGTRTGVPGRRSSGSAEGGDNLASEAGQPLSERGQRVRDRADEDGRSAIAGTADESQGTSQPTGRRGNVKSSKQPEPKFTRNYLYPEDASAIDNMTPQQRLSANVEALEVVRTLMKEGREATAEEREILGKYRGWGGVELGRAYSTDMMRRSFTDRWGTPTEQGKLLGRLADVIDELDPKGERGVLSAINRAALTSYYTPTGIAKVMNRFAELAGFKGGSMLDPSMGNGVFEGTMSKGVQQRTMIHGIELDWLTGQIARNLYPDANVLVTGYEQAGTADNAYDVVMSNIPFGSISVTDKTWKHDSSPVRKAAQGKIHNYFAVKMLDNTRPGGLCVIMTSNAILDTKGNQIIREHLADQAEVLGVVRLPDNTFKGAGTSVVTDVIFLRKYKDDADRAAIRGNEDYTANIEKPFLSSGELQLTNPTDGKTYKVAVNGYFTKNKGMMIGDAKAGGQYRADEFGLGSSLGTDELAKAMSKIVEKKIVGDRKGKLFDTHKTEREVHQAVSEAYKGDGNFISSGNIVEQDGMFGIVTSNKNKYGDVTSTFTEMPALKAKASRIRAMLPIREAMKELIAAEIGGTKEDVLKELRKKLQGAYDAYVKKFGHLNNKENDFLTEDIDGYTLRSLEKMKDGKFAGLSDIFTKNTIKPALDLSTAKTPQDAISLSLAEYGEINPSFMEDVLGESWAEQCGESLFRTPFTEDVYETADAYLSGDVKTKLEQAREAAKQDKAFERNVEALEAVQPKDIPFDEISIRMGARWIPADVYTDFMYDMFGIHKNDWKGNKSGVEYMPEVDQYVVNVANNELGGEADAWRTSRRAASEVFTAALQDKSLSVFDTIKEDGVEKKILNKEETELLNNKIQDLRTAFEDWLSQNPEREEMLMRMYNDKFNRTVLRKFDGSHLNVAGLMGKELRPHQKDAVWMLVNNRGGIVDHIVGAGKTLVMQSAIMEMRRMGIAKKPMIIALKATVAQIAKEFREAYPAARILAPTEKDFAKENRKKFMSQIALNDYDCVILSHDQYCMLPHTEEVERGVIDEQMMQLDSAIEYLYGQSDKSQLTKKQIKGLEKRKANLEAKLDKLLDRKIDREFTFEGLGVDYLFVDECQHFKSLPYVSTYDRVAGLGDKQGSQRAIALLNGVRYLQRMHQGDRGTVFLSGTTISNSLSEIYHLLNYLRPSEMKRLGMTTFDAWAGNYAIHTAELEYGVTNELKEKDRFRSLTNIPELSKMYAEIADVRNDLNLKLPKPKMRSHVVTVPQSDIMQEINREIVNMVKNKDGSYFGIDSKDTTPWGLLASTLSAKAAINPRLIDDTLDDEGGKIPAVCENVKKIYDQFKGQKGTQLIFCDTGVPGKGKKYDAYSDIINRLVNDYGIPRKEIADIHEAGTDEKRKELFAKVNEGSVRILIGGTKNMGTGVNVQKRIVAMHHVDVPWTPADREQREGRGVRQGNEIARDFNDDNVDVYFYATEGSLDMYKYQLQETKGKLFAQFKSGTIGDRTFDEGDAEGDFDPAEVVAMLSGNPVIFEKSKQDKKVEKLRRAKRAYESDWQRRRSRYEELQQKKRNFERLLSLNASDVRDLERGGFTPDEDGKYPTTVTVSVKDDYSSRRTFDKPKEAGEYIHSLLKQGKKVQLTGFNQKANITVPITDAGLFGKPVAELDSYGGIKYTVEVSDDDTAAGVAFRNLLQKVYSNRKVYERNLEDVNNQLKGADPGENKFPNQAELDEALKEKKRLDDEYKKLSDEESKPTSDEDTAKYRIREDEPPTKTGIGYKVFVLKDGKLYPPMVANPNGEATPVGVWLDADAAPVASVTKTGRQQVKAGGKGTQGGSGKLAYRPGWHLGEIPYALQFNRMNPETGQRELFPANFVWAEVEYANDVDYQEEAMSYGMNASGKFQHSLAGLPRLPENGSYRYRTNPDPNTDPWVITGAMKVNRILKPSEVDAMVEAAGREPQQRQAGAITDEQVEALNAKVKRTMQEDRDMMRSAVQQMGEKLHTDINIIEDVNEITHPNAAVQERRRKSKGWYDTATGQVNIVLDNNKNIDDVKASVGHETIAHKGLRELVGEENYDEFLDETYQHLRDDLKKGVDDAAGRAFIDDTTKNGKRAKSYEQHRRTAVDELFGRLAEKPFEEFSEGERTLWQKIKATVRRLLDKFLGSLKLPKWFELGDNELRYILWRSKERLERGKEHPIDLARDIVKREELGLGEDNTLYSETKKDAHPTRLQTSDDAQAVQRDAHLSGTKVEINSENREEIDKNLSSLAEKVAESQLPAEEFLAELRKSMKTESEDHSGYNIQVIDGEQLTMRISDHHANAKHNKQNGEFKVVSVVIKTPYSNNRFRPHKEVEMVEYTFDANKLTHDNEQNIVAGIQQWLETGQCDIEGAVTVRRSPRPVSEDSAVYRDPDETEDISSYNAGRMSLAERAAQAVAAMSAKNRADVEARREAVKALGGNLQKLRQAMARQREYDKGTVDAIVRQARIMLEGGMLDGMTRGEVKKLLSLVNKAAGREDITRQADGVVELMAKHLVRQGKATMESLLKTRDKKVNAKGVEAQGRLDVAGQRMIDAFREALPLDEETLAGWIADCEDRMGSEDSVTARNAEAEHEGLMLAKRHLEEIKASEAEEAELRHELKQAEEKVHGGDYSSFGSKEAYREYVRETEAAIRENLLERVEAYGRLNQQFGGNLVGSAARAKAFREAEKQRVREIQHNANSDLEGMPANEHGKIKKTFRDWDLVRLFMKPLATFNTMLRYFGGKSVDGRGYLFNRFMPQWQKAFDGEHAGLRAAHKELDAKVSEVMGRKMRWSDLFSLEREMDKNLGGGTEVEFMDDGKKRTMKLTQGNMLYIYMVNKMADGRMKLRGMGITEDIVEAIKSEIDPRFIEIADWIQDEFLVKKREEYNAVHERMFGASMAAIEDYFPLKINSRSRGKSEDVGSMESDEIMPGTIAGSIKKRTRNGLALDITGADAFDVVLEHLQEMEHWAHFAELNRDLNTLLSYKKFKNRVLGMKSLRYGGGEKIWQNFRDTCRIVAGTYRQSVTPDSADKFVTNVAKGVTGAKISFRIFTALKQLLSYPAYLSNASIVELAKSSNPVGMVKSWNWAIENLPGFAQRWQSRQAGDTRLMDTASDWSIWHSKVVEKATRWGMTPNAFVDGMTVAMGAKAIYETKLKGYKKAGYSDAAAEKKALEDASIVYNETQQSSASAYTSAMQLDRTVASTMLTVFRNASMGYQRKYFGALANLKRKMRKGYKDESIAFMAKQVQREWNGTDDVKDEDVSQEAKDYAKRLYYKSYYKDLADTVIFGWVLQFAWNLGPYLPYLLMGDDDDEKDAMLEDAAMHALAGGVEGLSGGNVMSDLYNLKRSGEKIGTYNFNLMPLMSDLQTTLKHFDNDAVSGMTDLVNLAVQSGFGFNPQTATDGIVALLDACEGDMGTAKEAGLFAMRVLQFPQSGLDKMLIDELGIGKDDVAHADFMDIATRYARYKRRRQAPLLGWMYSDEEKATKEKKKISGPYSFSEKVKERIVRLNDERVLGLVKRNDDKLSELAENELKGRVANYSDEQMNDIFEGSDDVMRKLAGKEVAKRIGGQDSYGSPKTEYGRVYEKKRKMFDVAEDVLLQTAKKKAKESGDEELEEAIEKGQRELTKIKKGDKKHYGLGELSDEEDDVIMEALRTRRKEIIRELRIK